jgi:hypothetical protein
VVHKGGLANRVKAKSQERFWLELVAVRISRWLGSLQMAVLLLLLFAFVLAIGTMVESWYSGQAAQELVYRTWWFTLLLALLGVNIFFAAAKKWPWKKYQTGFLITHVGLLTMVSGGILTSLSGVDSVMALVDSDLPQARHFGSHSTNLIMDRTTSLIRVSRGVNKGDKDAAAYPFEPGSLIWRSDQYIEAQTDTMLVILDWLAHPWPRTWARDVGNGARVEIQAYYPHTRQEQFSPAEASDRKPFAAVKFRMKSPRGGALPDQWIAGIPGARETEVGAGMIELLAQRCPESLLEEFRNPRPREELGKKGQLVIALGREKYRLAVDQYLGREPQPMGRSGLFVRIKDYNPNYTGGRSDDSRDEAVPANPVLTFELSADGKAMSFLSAARVAGYAMPLSGDHAVAEKLADLAAWYHPPDYRYGNLKVRGLLQFLTDEHDHLLFRSFSSASLGGFGLEQVGQVTPGQENYPVWKGMGFQMQVTEFLPKAANRTRFVPVNERPGLERADLTAAIRCRMSAGNESKEFWVGKSDGGMTKVSVGGEEYQVGYNSRYDKLDFEMKLLRAEQPVDPGTQQAAAYTSFVQLTDEQKNLRGKDCEITMNQPLEHRGYKLYQSGYRLLGSDPDTLKPVSQSVLTVARDPGLLLKYLGSSMLALGIVCMFYMKAYFFKPRGRRTATSRAASTANIL